MIRVLVCGGRDFQDYRLFARELCRVRDERGGISQIIHGGAKGADWCAHLFANAVGANIDEWIFCADWKAHGRKAGPMRNQRMLDEGRPNLIIAFHGGRGTADMVRRGRRAGIEVIEAAQSSTPSDSVSQER